LILLILGLSLITKDIITKNKNNTIGAINNINRINSNNSGDIMFIKANILNLFFKMFEK
jgi:hypothetical protein